MSSRRGNFIESIVFVGGLPNHVTSEELDNVFYKCGRIDRIWIARRQPNFAFVEFDNVRDAQYAVRMLDGTRICGVRARVEISRSRQRRVDSYYRDRSRSFDSRKHSRRVDNIKTSVETSSYGRGGGEFGTDSFSGDDWEESDDSQRQHRRSSFSKNTSQPSQLISQIFKCLVCYDHVPLSRIVFCNITFSCTQNSDQQVHAFCNDCVFGHASAAVGDIPLAKGGIGLRCMMPKCDNPILYSEIRMLLSNDLQTKLEERMLQESIGMALVVNLERCTKCNFAIEMEVDKNINKVFDCLACGYKICRLCERDWDDEHFGVSCKELDEKQKDMKDKKEREIEKKLNEAIVRKCPRCGIQFVKIDGCNKMTCRCGMTQCYLCREINISDTHFCQHFRDPTKKGCNQCDKKCLLHENSDKKDEQLIKEILKNEEVIIF